jgi:hypothetical protein
LSTWVGRGKKPLYISGYTVIVASSIIFVRQWPGYITASEKSKDANKGLRKTAALRL